MEKTLQFKFLEEIEIDWETKSKYEFLGTSNTKLPNCDYMLESYTDEELETIQTDWFIIK